LTVDTWVMADAHAHVVDAFSRRLAEFAFPADLDEPEAARLGREAAEAVIGPLVWRELLGADRWDTTQVARLLRVTRQAVHKRTRAGGLIGVPGRGTTWFPAWQFDTDRARVRPVVPAILAAWAEASGGEQLDPQTVLAWSKAGQPELDGQTPEEWVILGKEDEAVVSAAREAARALAA
jgi:hypothetical protein